MDYNKQITISFSIRPFKMAVHAFFLSCAMMIACVPASTANLQPPPPVKIMTAAEMRHKSQVDFVEAELRTRLKSADGIKIRAVATILVDEARTARLDPLFVLAVIEAESGYDVEACSPAHAKGLMQIVPSTFKWILPSGSVFDPSDNVRAGTRYLAHLSKSFRRPESILMAYNGGPGTATKYLQAQSRKEDYPISDEMRFYPGKVMRNYKRLLSKTGQKPQHAHKLFKVYDTSIAFVASR